MTCADCGHERIRHLPIGGPRGCTGTGHGVFIIWCECEGWLDPAAPAARTPSWPELKDAS